MEIFHHFYIYNHAHAELCVGIQRTLRISYFFTMIKELLVAILADVKLCNMLFIKRHVCLKLLFTLVKFHQIAFWGVGFYLNVLRMVFNICLSLLIHIHQILFRVLELQEFGATCSHI